MPPAAAARRQRGRAPRREAAYRELALDLEANDEEEYGEKTVVDPVAQRHAKRGLAGQQAEWHAPESLELRPQRRIGEDDGEQRCEQEQQAGGRRPPREIQGGALHGGGRASRGCLDERVLVPGSLVAPAVDEESRRHDHAAAPRARDVVLDFRPGPAPGLSALSLARRQTEPHRRDVEMFRRERWTEFHQRVVGLPVLTGSGARTRRNRRLRARCRRP